MPKLPPKPAPFPRAVMLTLPALLLAACATPYTPPATVCPANPPAPAMSEPMPSVSYSLSAEQRIKAWQRSLIDWTPTGAR